MKNRNDADTELKERAQYKNRQFSSLVLRAWAWACASVSVSVSENNKWLDVLDHF